MSTLSASTTNTPNLPLVVSRDPTPPEPVNDWRIQLVIETLPSLLDWNCTSEELAAHFGVSYSYLRQRFSEVTGQALGRYLKALRLDTARRLLATEYLTLKQVMARVGIYDVSHFDRDFRQRYGVSPRRYRDWHFPGGNPAKQRGH